MKKEQTEKEVFQSKKFVEKAKEIGTDDSPEVFEYVFNKVIKSKIFEKQQEQQTQEKK